MFLLYCRRTECLIASLQEKSGTGIMRAKSNGYKLAKLVFCPSQRALRRVINVRKANSGHRLRETASRRPFYDYAEIVKKPR